MSQEDALAGGGRQRRCRWAISILARVGNLNISAGMLSAARKNRTRGREEGVVSMEMTNNGNSAEDNVAAADEARKMGK